MQLAHRASRPRFFHGTSSTYLNAIMQRGIVPGAAPGGDKWATRHGLSLYAAVIVKYRDDKTSLSTTLEDLLR